MKKKGGTYGIGRRVGAWAAAGRTHVPPNQKRRGTPTKQNPKRTKNPFGIERRRRRGTRIKWEGGWNRVGKDAKMRRTDLLTRVKKEK